MKTGFFAFALLGLLITWGTERERLWADGTPAPGTPGATATPVIDPATTAPDALAKGKAADSTGGDPMPWYRFAAGKGSPEAQYRLMAIEDFSGYLDGTAGINVEASAHYNEVTKWLKALKANQDPDAAHWIVKWGADDNAILADAASDNGNYPSLTADEALADAKAAYQSDGNSLRWYRIAAVKGSAEAQNQLGEYYTENTDLSESRKWVALLRANPNPDAGPLKSKWGKSCSRPAIPMAPPFPPRLLIIESVWKFDNRP